MGGLVGTSPHMQSAAVLALARLVFEFAGQLEGVVGRLLPAVLLLFRSQSREIIKAVLGFVKVRLLFGLVVLHHLLVGGCVIIIDACLINHCAPTRDPFHAYCSLLLVMHACIKRIHHPSKPR